MSQQQQNDKYTVRDDEGNDWGYGATEADAWLEALESIGYRSMSMASDYLDHISELDWAVADLVIVEA